MKTLPRIAIAAASSLVALSSLLTPSCAGSATTPGTGSAAGAAGATGAAGGHAGTAAGGHAGTAAGGHAGTAAGGSGTGGTSSAAGTGATGTDTCATSADCTWGEIGKEILKPSDCICLFGCAYLPQTVATATRRQQQYAARCTPNKDGAGNPCPVDDCALPGAITCDNGTCKAAPSDAGTAQ